MDSWAENEWLDRYEQMVEGKTSLIITHRFTTAMRADVIQVSFNDIHFVPTYDVISHLVYVADEQDVASVTVDGRLLMRDGKFLTIDTDRVRKEATELAARIQSALAKRNQ